MTAVCNCLFSVYAVTVPEDHFLHLLLGYWASVYWQGTDSGNPSLIFFNVFLCLTFSFTDQRSVILVINFLLIRLH